MIKYGIIFIAIIIIIIFIIVVVVVVISDMGEDASLSMEF